MSSDGPSEDKKKQMAREAADAPHLIKFPHGRGSLSIRPEDMGKEKGRALKAMEQQTEKQYEQLFKQAKLLAEQAEEIKKRVEISEKIYMAELGFIPTIGDHYFLYKKDHSAFILSILSPEDWKDNCPFESFLAEVKLLADHTWEIIRGEAPDS